MKGVIIAAGYGTRFLPGTKTIPKEMFPLVDTPAIDSRRIFSGGNQRYFDCYKST